MRYVLIARSLVAAAAIGSFVACGGVSSDPVAEDVGGLRALIEERGIAPLVPVEFGRYEQRELGRMLFFDPILSGNRDQACATCHHPSHGSSDGRSLSVGTKAIIVDGVRLPGPDHTFTPRNAMGLWDLAQREPQDHRGGFWDRRVVREEDRFVLYDIGYETSHVPRLVLPEPLDSLVAAVAMLPVLDRDEMRGEVGELAIDGSDNELAKIFDSDFEGIWTALMKRLLAIEAYKQAFAAAYPDMAAAELHFAHAANAIGAFIQAEFQSTDTPWDQFLNGEDDALQHAAIRGARLFFGRAECGACHADTLLGDDDVHNYAVRPMTTGPKSDFEDVDLGAALRTNGGEEDRYAFRTPSLRNVEHTGPWMHNGCYTSLEAVVRHKRDPLAALGDYDKAQLAPEFRMQVHGGDEVLDDVAARLGEDVPREIALSETEVGELVTFLRALSSPRIATIESLIPDEVPSGLQLTEP
jgi:cytochrome c peroxidase